MHISISKDELEELYVHQKLNTYQIAEKLNCSQATIWKKLIKYAIPRRTPHELTSNIPSKDELFHLYINKKLSTWKIEKEYGYSRGTIHRKLKEYGIKTRDLATANIKYEKLDFSGNLIEKAYIIGFRLGDLRVRKYYKNSKTICVGCSSTIPEQITLIKQLFSEYGHVWINKSGNGIIHSEAYLNDSFAFLLPKKIPEWISKTDETFFSFISGFIDAEGSIRIYNNMAKFSLGNYDTEILKFIMVEFNKRGINSLFITDKRKGKFNNQGYLYRNNYSSIIIHRKQEILHLFSKIKPYLKHELKIEDLKKAEENIIIRNNKLK